MLHMAGIGALTVGGWLGGHLAYRLGVGVDHTAFEEAPRDWTTVARLAELADGEARLAEAGGMPVMLVRDGDIVHAIAATCSHEGGPLNDGRLEGGCVTCPWHGSMFRLEDGSVVRAPATSPQPAFDVRVVDGDLQVRPKQTASA
jgi:nitrite reductase/ring-hydroxylating ferredoxin subunit